MVEDSDDWNLHLSMVYLIECKQCGKVKPCELLVDPYLAELDPDSDNPEEYWCKDCYLNRAVQI